MVHEAGQAVNIAADVDGTLDRYPSQTTVMSIKHIWGQEAPFNELYIQIDQTNWLNCIFISCAALTGNKVMCVSGLA